MDAHLAQWIQLGARWLHVIAGVVWVGTSFYFTWLNLSLRPPAAPRPGVDGELWSVHGGGFYRVERFAVAPERLPEELHWFRWEAYTTWLTGAVLLVLVYYTGAGALLVPPEGPIGRGLAIGIGVAMLGGGWLVYDGLCRSRLGRRPRALGVALLVFAAGVAWSLGEVLSPRAAYLHVGAMLGTWMAANVLVVIIPGQRAMVRALAGGQAPDPERGRQGALRSLHNNYLALPVLFVMISGHYPVTYAHPRGWLVLVGIGLVGIAARHFYNRRHAGRPAGWLLAAAVAGLVGLALATRPARVVDRDAGPIVGRVSWPAARAVVEARCTPCHARRPTHPSVVAPPLGVSLETESEIQALGARIGTVVEDGTMPLGNLTGMTPEERALVVRWARESSTATRGATEPDLP